MATAKVSPKVRSTVKSNDFVVKDLFEDDGVAFVQGRRAIDRTEDQVDRCFVHGAQLFVSTRDKKKETNETNLRARSDKRSLGFASTSATWTTLQQPRAANASHAKDASRVQDALATPNYGVLRWWRYHRALGGARFGPVAAECVRKRAKNEYSRIGLHHPPPDRTKVADISGWMIKPVGPNPSSKCQLYCAKQPNLMMLSCSAGPR